MIPPIRIIGCHNVQKLYSGKLFLMHLTVSTLCCPFTLPILAGNFLSALSVQFPENRM